MMVDFRILTDGEVAEAQAIWEADAAVEAKRAEKVKACVAAREAHEWELDLFHPEDDVYAELRCVHCPAGMNDVWPDAIDMVYLDVEDVEMDGQPVTVEVREGRHNSPVPLVVPVTVDVEDATRWTDYGWEYDAELIVEQRGPARPMEFGDAA